MKKSKLILLIFVFILILGGIALFTNLKDKTIFTMSEITTVTVPASLFSLLTTTACAASHVRVKI